MINFNKKYQLSSWREIAPKEAYKYLGMRVVGVNEKVMPQELDRKLTRTLVGIGTLKNHPVFITDLRIDGTITNLELDDELEMFKYAWVRI